MVRLMRGEDWERLSREQQARWEPMDKGGRFYTPKDMRPKAAVVEPAPEPIFEYHPPSEEQLVNFVAVASFGPGASDTVKDTIREFLEVPESRNVWLERHREFQERVRGLPEAGL